MPKQTSAIGAVAIAVIRKSFYVINFIVQEIIN
jgi:hypothetical protein